MERFGAPFSGWIGPKRPKKIQKRRYFAKNIHKICEYRKFVVPLHN